MKRPLAVAGFTLLAALLFLCILDSIPVALILAGVAYCLFMVSAFIPKSRENLILPTVFFTCVAACFMFYYVQSDYEEISSLAEREAEIVCTVTQEPNFNETYGRYYAEAEIVSIDGEKYNGNIRLSFNTTYDNLDVDDFTIGNELSFQGHLYKVGGEDRGIVDYFKSEKIYIGVYGIRNFTFKTPVVRPVSFYGNVLREFVSEKFREYFSKDTAGFLTSLLTGNKDYVSEDIYSAFKNAGVAHLMAVSGMHLAVLTMFLNLLIKKLRKNHMKLYFVIMSTFILFIMFAAAFSNSVVRSGIMLLILLFGQCINKRADSLNSLGFACIFILLINPFAAMSAGFLLSVLSTMSIIVFSVPFCNKHRYFLCDVLGFSGKLTFAAARAVMFSIVVSINVMICTLPVMAMFFGTISLVSPLANLLFLPVNTLIIHLAFISAILCALGIMPDILIFITQKASSYCLYIADLLGGTDKFVLKIDSLTGVTVCCFVPVIVYLTVSAVSRLYKKYKKKKSKPL